MKFKFKTVFFVLAALMIFTFGTVKAEVAELTFWDMMWGPAETYPDAVKALVEEFNETHPDINVTVQMTPWNNFYQTFLTAVTSGAAPDVSTGAFPQDVQYAQMGEILSLDSIIEEWKEEGNPILDDFVKGTLTLKRYNGHTVGIPWNIDPRVIVYRTDVFKEAGVTEMPTTWDEFLAALRKVKENTDYIPFTYQGGEHSGTHAFLNFMFTNNIGITDENLNATFDDSKVVETLKFFRTMYEEGLIPDAVASYASSDTERLYLADKVASRFAGPFTALYSYPELGKNSAVMPVFAGPSGEKHALTWPNSIMAYSQTKHPEAAKTFIKWWIENNLSLWTKGHAGPMPARLSYYDNSYFKDVWLTNQIEKEVLPYAATPVWPADRLYPGFSQIEGENYLGVALQEVTTDKGGDVDYQEIVDRYNELIQDAVQQ